MPLGDSPAAQRHVVEPLEAPVPCFSLEVAWKKEQIRLATKPRRQMWDEQRRVRAALVVYASYNINGMQRVDGVPAGMVVGPRLAELAME